MNKRLRRLTAGLALATTLSVGAILTDTLASPHDDTTHAAPDTASVVDSVTGTVRTVVTPLDTTWG